MFERTVALTPPQRKIIEALRTFPDNCATADEILTVEGFDISRSALYRFMRELQHMEAVTANTIRTTYQPGTNRPITHREFRLTPQYAKKDEVDGLPAFYNFVSNESNSVLRVALAVTPLNEGPNQTDRAARYFGRLLVELMTIAADHAPVGEQRSLRLMRLAEINAELAGLYRLFNNYSSWAQQLLDNPKLWNDKMFDYATNKELKIAKAALESKLSMLDSEQSDDDFKKFIIGVRRLGVTSRDRA